MKSLLRLAATNVHLKCNKMWYTHSDGLAMGASLVVILANLWMKSFEKSLQKSKKGREIQTPDTKMIRYFPRERSRVRIMQKLFSCKISRYH